MYEGMGLGWFGMGLSWIVPFIVAYFAFSIFYAQKNKEESARDILDRRYANGEIDDEEYKTKRDALGK